jgi:hypothetical protein
MSASRVAQTLANGLAADPFSCAVPASVQLHLKHQVDLQRVVGIGEVPFSEF